MANLPDKPTIPPSPPLRESVLVKAAREIGAEKMAIREAYIAQYLELTGHKIEDLELVNWTEFSENRAVEVWYLRLRTDAGAR